MRPRRALMYMPGHDMRKIQKAISLKVDSVCMDMEDGVAANRKLDARSGIAEALQSLEFGSSERLVRINPVHSGLAEGDLDAVLGFHPDGIVLPKAETAAELEWVDRRVAAAEREQGWPENSLALMILVETPLAVIRLAQLCQAVPRLEALVFGADDLAAYLHAMHTPDSMEVFYARSAVVLHAAAFGLQAIDQVKIDFRDDVALLLEARQGADMGYTGKQIIHPNQWPIVAEAYTPSASSISEARRILDEFTQRSAAGTGAFALEGHIMVDMPSVRAAQNTLERARAAGIKVAD